MARKFEVCISVTIDSKCKDSDEPIQVKVIDDGTNEKR